MNKTSRRAAIIGVVCGAEVIAAAVIGGAGLAALVSIEAAFIAAVLGGVALWFILDRRASGRSAVETLPPTVETEPFDANL